MPAPPAQGYAPVSLAVLNDAVYVANSASANVSVVKDGAVTSVVRLPGNPSFVAADPTTGYVYVLLPSEPGLAVLDGDTLIARWPLSETPESILAADGRVYVGLSHRVLSLDGLSGAQIASISVEEAFAVLTMAISRQRHTLFAGGYGITYRIDLHSLKPSVFLSLESYRTLGVDDARGLLYIGYYDAEASSSMLAMVDLETGRLVGRVPLCCDPRGLAVDEERGLAYVACSCANSVYVVDGVAGQVVDVIPVGRDPVDVALAEEGLYVAQQGSHSLALLREGRISKVIPLALAPEDMVVEPQSGNIYATSPGAGGVFVIGKAGIEHIPTGRHPAGLAVDPLRGLVYVADALDSQLTILEGSQLVDTIPLPAPARSVAFNPRKGLLYAGRSILDGKTREVLGSLELPPLETITPLQMTTSPDGERLFVVAYNGVPGSNGANIVYVMDAETGKLLQDSVGGLGVHSFTLCGDLLYTGTERFGICRLVATSLSDFSTAGSLELPCYVLHLSCNPAGDTLLVLLSAAYYPWEKAPSELLLLDTSTLSEKGRWSFAYPAGPVASHPALERLYLFNRMDAYITVLDYSQPQGLEE